MILVNSSEVKFTEFPNGELKIETEVFERAARGTNKITFKFEDNSDLIKLMFVKKHLDRYNCECSLTIYYMPYSRMDRKIEGFVFTLKYVAEFINDLNFTHIKVIEPHSDVTTALLNKSVGVNVTEKLLLSVLNDFGFEPKFDYLFFPDAGAQKRYGNLKGFNQLVGYKDRDVISGKINSLEVVGKMDFVKYNKKVLIIDDLCSYGGTFIMAAKKLKEIGIQDIYLLVGHAEKSIFNGELFASDIKKVYTTNSILNKGYHMEDTGRLKIYDLGAME